jgi:type III secretion protein I
MNITATSMALGSLAVQVGPVAPPLLASDALATAQFSDLLAAPGVAPLLPPVITEADNNSIAIAPPTMGDNILKGLQTMASEFKQSMTNVSASLDAGTNMGVSDLLKVQMGLMQMSVQYELIGKGISRSTQNLDQLVKIQ